MDQGKDALASFKEFVDKVEARERFKADEKRYIEEQHQWYRHLGYPQQSNTTLQNSWNTTATPWVGLGYGNQQIHGDPYSGGFGTWQQMATNRARVEEQQLFRTMREVAGEYAMRLLYQHVAA